MALCSPLATPMSAGSWDLKICRPRQNFSCISHEKINLSGFYRCQILRILSPFLVFPFLEVLRGRIGGAHQVSRQEVWEQDWQPPRPRLTKRDVSRDRASSANYQFQIAAISSSANPTLNTKKNYFLRFGHVSILFGKNSVLLPGAFKRTIAYRLYNSSNFFVPSTVESACIILQNFATYIYEITWTNR